MSKGGAKVEHRVFVSQQCALMAKRANGVPVGQWLTKDWPMVGHRVTMSQQRALVAMRANGDQEGDQEGD